MTTPHQHARILHFHTRGLNDPQIAARLGVSARTVANFRRSQQLPANAHNVVLAREGEQLILNLARSLGLDAERSAAWGAPFDLRIGPHRIEVKTGQDREELGVFKFSTSPTRKGKYVNPKQRKDYARDADFMVFVCKSVHAQPTRVFIMTPAEMAPSMRIDLSKGLYAQHEDAWDRLDQCRDTSVGKMGGAVTAAFLPLSV